MDDYMESQGRPLIRELEEEDVSETSHDHSSATRRPVIEEINQRFSRLKSQPNKAGKPLIEELDPVDDSKSSSENSKPLITEMSHDEVAAPDINTAEPKQSGLNVEADSQSSLGPSWETLQKLAEQVGSTIEREPLDIDKEKKAFVKRMLDTNLGDLD